MKTSDKDSVDLLGLVPELYRRSVETVLLGNWNRIAAHCYRYYLGAGKGLLSLRLDGDRVRDCFYIAGDLLKSNWTYYMQGTDPEIQALIRKFLKTYDPETQIVLLLQFAPDEADNNCTAMQIFWASLSLFSQRPDSIIPVIQRRELLSPRQAYEADFNQSNNAERRN